MVKIKQITNHVYLVLFVFNDGNLSKGSVTWRLERVSKVGNMKVSILASVKTNGFYFKYKVCLVGISDVTSRHKFYCTACITLSYFNTLMTEDSRVRIEERLRIQRSKEYNHGLSMLIPQEGEKTWGEKRKALVLWLTELSKDWTFQ